ncbi:uncharacterized protein EI90DRAFT_3018404 [Cantharellus anzutake]|uniref:uncharacterized protein n=1 Tax=Cantharellus anzutake TaxID=1750568 RepID=UPI0019038D5E|nr:uncharacterized protein EI90DRAFT_3018404 [Cantharellus anzutake]KAF8326786.1 hypothetical protein EI90DRAFT_3018404 [Cantharellus anzutake]
MSFSDVSMSTPGPSAPPEDLATFNPGVLLNLLQQQVIQHQDLMTAIQAQQQHQQVLMETFQIHLQNVAAAPNPAPALAPASIITVIANPTAKFPDPMAFTGKPSGVRAYIAEIES